MSCLGVINNNSITKKCGEIVVTTKNAKNIYSFNCLFCDTICIQMKKFTLHLEKEHITQLEQTTSFINTKQTNPDGIENRIYAEKEPVANNISVGEIKIEDFISTEIKSESNLDCYNGQDVTKSNEKHEKSLRFQDPLETFGENIVVSLHVPVGNEPFNISNTFTNDLSTEVDAPTNDVEMNNFSNDEHHEEQSDSSSDDNSSDSDFTIENNADVKRLNLNPNSKDKALVLALIEEYSKSPQLWSTSLTERCSLKQKDILLEKITTKLNRKLKMNLKLYLVKKSLSFICTLYEKEIERELNETETKNEMKNSELWFYEEMSFLKSTIESKLKLKKLRKKKAANKMIPLNDDLLCDLVEIYKNYNSLWDVNHLAYTVKEKRYETMESMLDEVKQKMNLSLDIKDLEKHLIFIHKTFAKDKLYRLECQAKQENFKPTCTYFNNCDFLEAHQGPFRCADCNEIVRTYNDFQVHKSQHSGLSPFKCLKCGMGFKKIFNYTIHAKRHLGVFKFHCEICGKGYPFNAELDLHMRSHTGAQPYLCSICGEGFRTAISYDNHIRRHEERFKYFCHICKKGFNHMTRLNDHVKAHLNVRDIICTVCGKGFTSRKYLNHHKRIHEGKNYRCNICGKGFAQDAGLRAHKKYHGTPIGVSSKQKEQKKVKKIKA